MSPAPQAWRRRPVLLGVLLLMLASQISITLFTGEFKISVAVVLLPVLLFLVPGFPVLPTALLAGPGVFLLRSLLQWASAGTPEGCWQAHGPEIFFYLAYGLQFYFYQRRVPFHPFRWVKCLPLMGFDFAANLVELLVRLGAGAFSPPLLLQLLAVGAGRALLSWAAIRALDYYGYQMLRREDTERYQRLLLMTAALKGEVVWMEKGACLVEDTMNAAYQLYSQLRSGGGGPAAAETALAIAKDIHEVKKEYFLIMRGISEALDTDTATQGMDLEEIVRVLGRSVEQGARDAGKQVVFTGRCAAPFHTARHHYLMSIFRNLLNNAVEAAPGGGTAHVSLTEYAQGEEYVFEVADDCGGVPPERLERIFLPGFSSKINYSTGAVNRGLGLTIVRDLIEGKLKGTVAAANRDGGCVFTVRIPKQELEGEAHAVLPD